MAVAQPVSAKLRAPRLPEVLVRTRLFRLLDGHIRIRPIVWIAAPPGAGKTTLAASYLAARRRPSVWYRIDEEDADPATFTHYLGLAAQQAIRSRRPFQRLMPEQRARMAAFAREFFAELVARIGRRTLVLDNFQLLPEKSPTHELLTAGLADVPRGTTVLVLSRREPPPSFAPLAAARSVGRVEPNALNLTLREASALARLWLRTGRDRLSARALEVLFERTRGWVAGLVLFLEQNATIQAAHLAAAANESPETVFDYLAHELVDGFTPEEQTFLTEVAILPTMRPRAAEALTGFGAAAGFLERLHRSRTFTERRTHSDAVYQFHPLFRDFLLRQLETGVPRDEQRRLRLRAAELLASDGAFEDALALYQDCGEAEPAARLILQGARTLLSQGRYETVANAIRKLPATLLAESPDLQYTLAVAMGPARPAEVAELLERARLQFIARGDRAGALRALTHQIFAVIFSWTDLRPLDRLIDAAETLLPTLLAGPFEQPEEVMMAAHWMQALAWRRPWDERLPEFLGRMTRVVDVISDPDAIAIAAAQVAYLRLWYGDVALARDVIQRARQRCQGKALSSLARWFLTLAEGILAWSDGDGQRCVDVLSVLMRDETRTGYVYSAEVIGYAQLIMGALLSNDLELARQAADRMRPAFDKRVGATDSVFQAHPAWVALEVGDRTAAERHVTASLEGGAASGPFLETHARVIAALLAHDKGDAAEADRQLAIAHEMSTRMKSRYLEFVCVGVAAGIALDRGDRTLALHTLASALGTGRTNGLYFGFGLRRAMMSRLLALALEAGLDEPYVLELIRRQRLLPPEPTDTVMAWPGRLSIRALGGFSVSRDGSPLRSSRKTQRRPLALLQALIAFGGREVAAARLADALWPDADGDASRHALDTTLHRLRRLLGCDEAIEAVGGRLGVSGRHCAVDVWAFESLAAQVDSSTDPDLAHQAAERALALYPGAFLPEEMDAAWAVATRERLRARHRQLVLGTVERWRQRGSFGGARAVLERAIEVEPMEERFYRELTIDCERLGNLDDAQAVRDRYRRTVGSGSGAAARAEAPASGRARTSLRASGPGKDA